MSYQIIIEEVDTRDLPRVRGTAYSWDERAMVQTFHFLAVIDDEIEAEIDENCTKEQFQFPGFEGAYILEKLDFIPHAQVSDDLRSAIFERCVRLVHMMNGRGSD